VSLGGALGGLLCGIAAPLLFNYYWELPIALMVFALLVGWVAEGWMRNLTLVSVGLCMLFFYQHVSHVGERTIEMGRNFYGTLRIRATLDDSNEQAKWRLLHGVITHGEQYRNPKFSMLPTTYYGEESGVGRAIIGLREVQTISSANPSTSAAPTASAGQSVGLIGLGVGTLAAYGREGDRYRLYELNPQVLDYAQRRYTYLKDSKAKIESALGDARLVLEKEPPQNFDVLAIDAFSSDSIPVHLVTREAIKLYAKQVKENGVIAFHISNRYLDLSPIVAQLAQDIGYTALSWIDDPSDESYLYRSDWILVTKNTAFINWLQAQAKAWEDKRASEGKESDSNKRKKSQVLQPKPDIDPWTDDRNNLFQILK
jgi:spermidine synthase